MKNAPYINEIDLQKVVQTQNNYGARRVRFVIKEI